MTADNIFDDPFHICAWRAWFEIAEETGQYPPDSELTRLRAYALFERRDRTPKTAK